MDAVTGSAYSITDVEAILTGVAFEGASYWFEYGTSDSYGTRTKVTKYKAARQVEVEIGELDPSTHYHFRLAVEGPRGTSYGCDVRFTTREPNPAEPQVHTPTFKDAQLGHVRQPGGHLFANQGAF